MPTARERLRRMATEREPPSRGFAWDELMEVLGQWEDAARSPPARRGVALEDADVGALAALVAGRGGVPLRGTVPVTHCMPPEERVQLRALKILEDAGRLDCVRDSLARVGREADAPALRELARRLLSRLGATGEESARAAPAPAPSGPAARRPRRP